MSWRLFISRILPISSLLLVVLFKFENCAQSPEMFTTTGVPGGSISDGSGSGGSGSGSSGSGGGSGVVGIVDNFNNAPITFVANPQLVSPPGDGPMAVQGLCVGGRDQQVIDYQVIDMRDTPKLVNAGQVECRLGGFELPVAKLNLKKCEDRYEVRAARVGEPSHFATTFLQLDCHSSEVTEPAAD